MTTISQALARFACSPHLLAAAEIRAAKAAISDCMGCIVAGSDTEAAAIIRRVAEASSSEGPCTVVGSSRALTAQGAAMVNGTAAHALDYDDILWTLYGHPSVTVLPAALAVAESVGASGQDLLRAYAVGVEIIGKLGRSMNPTHYEHGWHATASIGVIGATAAAAMLMQLGEARTAMALGIAASQASGVRRNFGTMTKPFHAGNAARAGVLAAEMAREGFTADLTAFEGEFGWARTLNGRSVPVAQDLLAQLGKPWDLIEPGIVLKRYPACGGTHCALDAILALREEHALRYEEIVRIECHASPLAKKVLLYPRPTTGLEGKFSMEFSLAVAAIEGAAGLRHYQDAWTRDARVQDLLPRISFESRADLQPDVSADAVPAEVTVHARGRTFTQTVRVPSGDARNPMTDAQRREKFMGCMSASMPSGQGQALFDALDRLEQMDALGTLGQQLRQARGQAS